MNRFVTATVGTLSTFLAFTASAAPQLYTFSGIIDYIEIDGAYYSDVDFDNDYTTTGDTFKSGDVVEYTFLVDFDLPGFCAGPLGTTYSTTCTGVDIPDNSTANYFFTDLVSATKLAPATEEGTTFNYGLSLSNLGWLVADSAVFIVSPYNIPVSDWIATSDTDTGTIVTGTDAWAAANGNSPYGRISSTLTLMSIVPVVIDNPKTHCEKHDDRNKSELNDHKSNHSKNTRRPFNFLDKHSNDDFESEKVIAEKNGMKIMKDKHSKKVRIKFDKNHRQENIEATHKRSKIRE